MRCEVAGERPGRSVPVSAGGGGGAGSQPRKDPAGPRGSGLMSAADPHWLSGRRDPVPDTEGLFPCRPPCPAGPQVRPCLGEGGGRARAGLSRACARTAFPPRGATAGPWAPGPQPALPMGASGDLRLGSGRGEQPPPREAGEWGSK